MKYEVVLHQRAVAAADYTAADYVADCEKNADPEWCEMLAEGEVELVGVEE